MLITILYTLWILYTVGTLSIVLGIVGLSYWASWENKKHQEWINKKYKLNEDEQW